VNLVLGAVRRCKDHLKDVRPLFEVEIPAGREVLEAVRYVQPIGNNLFRVLDAAKTAFPLPNQFGVHVAEDRTEPAKAFPGLLIELRVESLLGQIYGSVNPDFPLTARPPHSDHTRY